MLWVETLYFKSLSLPSPLLPTYITVPSFPPHPWPQPITPPPIWSPPPSAYLNLAQNQWCIMTPRKSECTHTFIYEDISFGFHKRQMIGGGSWLFEADGNRWPAADNANGNVSASCACTIYKRNSQEFITSRNKVAIYYMTCNLTAVTQKWTAVAVGSLGHMAGPPSLGRSGDKRIKAY